MYIQGPRDYSTQDILIGRLACKDDYSINNLRLLLLVEAILKLVLRKF